MDHNRRHGYRGGGRGGRSQSSNLLHSLQKPLPPEELPEVQVPKWVTNSLEKWVPQLESVMADGESLSTVRKMMDKHLSESKNVYWTTIQMVTWSLEHIPKDQKADGPNSQVDAKAKNDAHEQLMKTYLSLPLMAMKTLADCLAGGHQYTSALNEDIKIFALSKVLEKASNELFQEVNNLYHLKANPEVFLPHIRRAIAEHKYVAAGRAVAMFNLQDRFKVTDILFPMVMLDRMGNVFSYLNEASTEKSTDLVQFLDAVLDQKFTDISDMVKKLQIPDVKKEHLSKKHISRCTLRLADKYNVPQDFCKNAWYVRKEGVLMFLIMKRYADKGIPVEDWEDLLCGFVNGNRRLGRTAVIRMAYKDDLDMAATCAEIWGIPVRTLPAPVRDAVWSGRLIQKEKPDAGERNRDEKTKPTLFYAPRQLPMAPIEIVDTISKFDVFIAKIKKDKIVGMDSEWRPVFMGDKAKVAVLQLATKDRVYLLDTMMLKRDPLMDGKWSEMEKALFANQDVVKLGFSLRDDWQVVEAIHPSLQDLEKRLANILDLSVLCDNAS